MHGWEENPEYWKKFIFHFKKNEKKYYDLNLDNIGDFVIVLAGGINEKDKDIYPWIKERLDIAVYLYQQKPLKIICVGGGTYHKKPILNDKEFVIHEAQACASYLLDNGVKPEDILKEWASFDTIANGYFTFTNFILPLQIKQFTLITSKFHIYRSKLIFDYFNEIFETECQINYLCSRDETLNQEIYEKRLEREITSAKNLKENVLNKGKEEFIYWFYTEHKAYNCINYDKNEVCEKLKESY